jgi:hypothetical protein
MVSYLYIGGYMAKEEVKYLTEKSLGEILKKIFPKAKVEPQYKYNGRKADYAVIGMPEQFGEKLGDFFFDSMEDMELDGDTSTDDFEKREVTLLVELDGHYHYTMPNSALNFAFSLYPVEQDDQDVFLIRIPYWIQLDATMSYELFGVKEDFSNGFPHGFVSKKCITPARFCALGEKRFLTEYMALPEIVRKAVLKSLIDKIREKGTLETVSRELLVSLISSNSDSAEFFNFLDKNWTDKFYKHFDSKSIVAIRKTLEHHLVFSEDFTDFKLSDRNPHEFNEEDVALAKQHANHQKGYPKENKWKDVEKLIKKSVSYL